MMRRLSMALLSAAILLSACGDEDNADAKSDGGTLGDAGKLAGDAAILPDCYPTPSNYLELINACTTAEKVVKNPALPLLLIDGGLPPLP